MYTRYIIRTSESQQFRILGLFCNTVYREHIHRLDCFICFCLFQNLEKELISYFVFIGFRLEERQRAEKRNREAEGHQFTPRWFDRTDEITPTPWGELEVYQYNGKYTEHRATADSSESFEDPTKTEFNPWQYDNLGAE